MRSLSIVCGPVIEAWQWRLFVLMEDLREITDALASVKPDPPVVLNGAVDEAARLDRIRGMLWMVAYGDALGAPHEFIRGADVTAGPTGFTGRLQHPLRRLANRFQPTRTGAVGQVTDDTEMMLALARTLAEHGGGHEPGDAALAYMAWANSGCPFMGKNTRALFKGVKTLRGYCGRYKKEGGDDNPSQGNGCLMRCAPLAAIRDRGLAALAAKRDCAVTNPTCPAPVQFYVTVLWRLLAGDPIAEAADVDGDAVFLTQDALMVDTVNGALGDGDRDVTGETKGWVYHALWVAVRALKKLGGGESVHEILGWAVRLGGDTDTNAAIAGAALGAAVGYSAIAEDPVMAEELAVLRAAPEKYAATEEAPASADNLRRPLEYTVAGLDAICEQLAALE